MNLVFFTARFPLPNLKGDQVILWERIQFFSKFYTVHVVYFGARTDVRNNDIISVEKYAKLIFCNIGMMNKILGLCLNFFARVPLQNALYRSPFFVRKLKNIVKQIGSDSILYFSLLRTFNSSLVGDRLSVLDAIDSMTVNLESKLHSNANLISRLILRSELKRVRQFERELSRPDLVVCVSKRDVDVFESMIGRRQVIPLGVDLTSYAYTPSTSQKSRFVFFGNLDYFPNLDVVRRLSKLFSSDEYKSKGYEIDFIGKISDTNLPKSICENVRFLGYVEDLPGSLCGYLALIAPLRLGSGMQNKILQAMASGVPVITTTYGIGEIRASHYENVVIEDDEKLISKHILKLIAEPDFSRLIAQNARKLVEEQHSWPACNARLHQLIKNCK